MNPHNSINIDAMVEAQLAQWPEAKKNYDALMQARRKPLTLGSLDAAVQFNAGRIRSTAANVDKMAIAQRPCFLCKTNRPVEQIVHPILPGWEMLVNPYPIFPIHFTIVSERHEPQAQCPPEIVSIAEKLPGMAVFFNGAKAGASAPDHLHLQAVLKDELPLMRLVERLHSSDKSEMVESPDLAPDLPFYFISGIIRQDSKGPVVMASAHMTGGPNANGELHDPELVNKFYWIDSDGAMRFVIVPRRAHRPACYFAEGEAQRLVSPGAIDMAGVMIVAREEDFNALDQASVAEIYSQVALKI